MSLPIVSIIIPILDWQNEYSISLNSLLNQSYKNLEIILLHDDLNEKTQKILDDFLLKFSSFYKFILIKKKSLIELDKINQGLLHATGEYITFLRPSDYFHKDRISILVDKAKNHELDFLFTRIEGLDSNHQVVSFENPWKEWYERAIFNCINIPTLECIFLNDNIAITYGNLFFSKKVIQTVVNFQGYKYYFTLDFILRSMKSYNISFLNETLYYYSIPNEITNKSETNNKKEELNKIYYNYLSDSIKNEFKNQNAPSHKNWQLPFNKILNTLSVNHFFSTFIEKPQENLELPKTDTKLEKSQKVNKKNKKITLITHDLALGGGAPKLVLQLSTFLINQGFNVSVISAQNGPLKKQFEDLKIPISIFPQSFLKWSDKKGKAERFFYLIASYIYLNFKTSSHILFNSSASWQLALPLSFSFFKKMNWYIHESFSPVNFLETGICKKLMKKAIESKKFSFWFGSSSTKEIWENSLSITGKVLYWSGLNHTNSDLFHSKPIKNLLAVGTSSERKGFHFLVDAFISLIKNKKISDDVHLTIIGFPKKIDLFNANIILKILSEKLNDRIKLVSCINSSEMELYFNKADLFIQPSVLECMPLSLLQAMALNIPIVSTDVQGCKEAIIENETGYLCSPYNVDSLKNTILKAIDNPVISRKMAKNAVEHFNKTFSLNVTLPAILSNLTNEKESIFQKQNT